MIEIDRKSLLVHVSAETTLDMLEQALATSGLTLGIAGANAMTVGAFLEAGAPGAPAPWDDPADHLVAGIAAVEKVAATSSAEKRGPAASAGDRKASARAPRKINVRPAPRRAVGPDLVSLVTGQGGRFFEIESVWLRVHPLKEMTARSLIEAFHAPPQPPLNAGEEALLTRIADALQRGPEHVE